MRYLSCILLGFIIFISCQSNTEPEKELQVDEQVTEQAALGFEIIELSGSVGEAESMTSGLTALDLGTTVALPGMPNMLDQLALLKRDAFGLMKNIHISGNSLRINSDSLIFYDEINLVNFVRRTAIYYNPETGIARLYEVKEGSMFFHLNYDSSEIRIDANKTLYSNEDDKVKSLYQLRLFDDVSFINKIEGEISVTDYEGTRITGFIAEEHTYYNGLGKLTHKSGSIEVNPDESGTIQEVFDFSDGTSSTSMITFYNNYTGIFSRTYRNGILVSGSFNRIEDDLYGNYSETIDFPDKHYVDKIMKYAEVTISLPDTVLDGLFRHVIQFSSGEPDSAQVDFLISHADGVKTTIMEITRHNSAHGTLTLVEDNEGKTLEGEWTTWNGYYVLISGTYLYEGSATLHYEVYASRTAYENGDDPIFVADYTFYPDGTGDGQITHQGGNFNIEFDDAGNGLIKKDGRQLRFNAFRKTGN
ncbi:MAG: hypothetical protein JXR46_13275 [Calditrichaceae bacterium]|nr:hypothetical protein [Calditrichaceae bacterium]MBN2710007.1 hypothetical protein [Calditrichaceae bacterium]RQV97344.1 MAG: hypothetical protein EH224_02015 [Calditrichota bacterium]